MHLFGDSVQPPFNPMLITYYLSGKIPLERCYLFGKDNYFFNKYKIFWHKGSPIVHLGVQEQVVINDHGEKIHYQSCLVASGASAIVPPISGTRSRRVLSIRTIEDAVRLREYYLEKPNKVLVVGASMVGIKLVEMFQEIGSEVVLLDLAPHVFVQAAHPQCAWIMEEQLRQRGIKLLFNSKIEGIQEGEERLKLSLSDQTELEVDLLIFCIGVKPNLDFIPPGDIEMDRGILVNQRMQSSIQNIYAAGDAAQGLNLCNQRKEIIALWANACQQGMIAGANMVGGTAVYPGSIPQNITHFFNVFFVSVGDIHHFDEVEEKHEHESYAYIFKRKGQTVGINFLNIKNCELIDSSGIYRYELFKTLQHNLYKE